MSEPQTHPLDEAKGGVRSPTIRKLAKDGTSWTPTEKLKRNRMLRRFCRLGRKGVGLSGNSKEYQERYELIDWGGA